MQLTNEFVRAQQDRITRELDAKRHREETNP
jgi:hypothetical protein